MPKGVAAEHGANGSRDLGDLDAKADSFKEAAPTLPTFLRVGQATGKPVASFSPPSGIVAAPGTLTVRTPIHQAGVKETLLAQAGDGGRDPLRLHRRDETPGRARGEAGGRGGETGRVLENNKLWLV